MTKLDPATVEACAQLIEDEGTGLLLPAAYKRLAARIRSLAIRPPEPPPLGDGSGQLNRGHHVGVEGAPLGGLRPAREIAHELLLLISGEDAMSFIDFDGAGGHSLYCDQVTAALEADRASRGTK